MTILTVQLAKQSKLYAHNICQVILTFNNSRVQHFSFIMGFLYDLCATTQCSYIYTLGGKKVSNQNTCHFANLDAGVFNTESL